MGAPSASHLDRHLDRHLGRLPALFLGLCLGLLAAACGGGEAPGAGEPEPLEVGSVLGAGGGAMEGFERALEPRPFVFPADHGPHPDFRSEWWYFVGNLTTTGDSPEPGRRFGFQLTFFRFAVAPEPPASPSDWATRQVWMAHLAVTDAVGERFVAVERFRRGALGLAGAVAGPEEPFRVWLDDWQAAGEIPGRLLPLRLQAAADTGEVDEGEVPVALDLLLEPGKPPVLQGEDGLSAKGPEPGNASYYYSLTRLSARGTVTVDGRQHEVTGSAWLDREWSTSALGEDEVGWDWFSLQLDDDASGAGREIMLYQIRERDGGVAPTSEAVVIAADGTPRRLPFSAISLEATGAWTSPASGSTYPSGWRLEIPSEDLDLTLTPVLEDQELDVSFRYWEGAVDVTGTAGGEGVDGVGYVELTGY